MSSSFVLLFCLLTNEKQAYEICNRERRQVERGRRFLLEPGESQDHQNVSEETEGGDADAGHAAQPIQQIVLRRGEITE